MKTKINPTQKIYEALNSNEMSELIKAYIAANGTKLIIPNSEMDGYQQANRSIYDGKTFHGYNETVNPDLIDNCIKEFKKQQNKLEELSQEDTKALKTAFEFIYHLSGGMGKLITAEILQSNFKELASNPKLLSDPEVINKLLSDAEVINNIIQKNIIQKFKTSVNTTPNDRYAAVEDQDELLEDKDLLGVQNAQNRTFSIDSYNTSHSKTVDTQNDIDDEELDKLDKFMQKKYQKWEPVEEPSSQPLSGFKRFINILAKVFIIGLIWTPFKPKSTINQSNEQNTRTSTLNGDDPELNQSILNDMTTAEKIVAVQKQFEDIKMKNNKHHKCSLMWSDSRDSRDSQVNQSGVNSKHVQQLERQNSYNIGGGVRK